MSWSGQNSEKPPIPQGEQQLYPPPPTDPNHYQQQQQQQQPQSGFSEKPTSELPGQQPGGQYFPPPPSGPPPAGQPQFTHAPQPQYGASQQQQQQHQPYGQPPQGQFPPGQQPGENPALYGAGHHYTATGASHADPAAAPAAAAFASTETTQPQKQHRGWGERLSQMGMKAAVPINALANKMGSQSFLPTTMDKECEKAGKILRSFCKEGIASDVPPQPVSDHLEPGKHAEGHGSRPVTPNKDKEKVRKEQKAIVKIPSKVINKAVGLAIFTTARAGFQFSGATGSGILIARLPDGSWGPPSGIQVHSVGAGFMIGVDIFDGVLVINNKEALSAFMGTRVSLGPDVAVVAGPYGAGGNLDVGASFGGKKSDDKQAAEQAASAADATPTDGKLRPDDKQSKRRSSSTSLKPVFSYVKSRGFYAGIQVDGTVVTERKDANAAFYGQKVSVEQIVRGQVPPQGPNGMWPAGAQPLYEALRIAEAQQSLPEVNLPQATPAAPPGTGAVPGQAPGYGVPPHQAQYGGVPQQPQYGGKPEGTALPAYGQPQYPHHEGGPLGSHPPDYSNPTASGALGGGEQLPGYVDDGAHRPGVGDHKGPATYQ
ncbi:SH3 domain-containing protein [Colletotrichum spinosum]|uniref:SH3 domain-containing protein n=1 Tax=Colletotrichum spinosum TaxID=1347390 RepID=A0A4R8Q8B8_9PEZI|nr:SH3 domain-containing protein [Colletotrichum spinosum]